MIGQGAEGMIEDNAFYKRSAKPTESLLDAERDRWKVETKVRRMIIIMKY